MQQSKPNVTYKHPLENNELFLLDRVFLRIGSAESDEDFQINLSKFLPPILKKLSSNQENVRIKVMEILLHINRRARNRPEIKLPVELLLVLYKDPIANIFVRNFTILYIKMGFPRLDLDKKLELIPTLIEILEYKPVTHQESMCLQIIPLLEDMHAAKLVGEKHPLYVLNNQKKMAKVFLGFLLDLLIMPYGAIKEKDATSDKLTSSAGTVDPEDVPAGISETSFRKIAIDSNIKGEDLEKLKMAIVNFTNSAVLPDQEIFVHMIVASSDTRYTVTKLVESRVKDISRELKWNLPENTLPLFELFLGSKSQTDPLLHEKTNRTPVSSRIQLRILNCLQNTLADGFIQPHTLNCIFKALNQESENNRLQLMGLKFAEKFVRNCDTTTMSSYIPLLFNKMYSLLNCENEIIIHSQLCIVIGHIGYRFPDHVQGSLGLLNVCFKTVAKTSDHLKQFVREGMLLLLNAYKIDVLKRVLNHQHESKSILLHELLTLYVKSEDNVIRFIAVTYMANIFQSNHAPSIYLMLLVTADTVDEISNQAYKVLYGCSKSVALDVQPIAKGHVFPNRREMVLYVYKHFLSRIEQNKFQTDYLPFDPPVYLEILIYLRLCMIHHLDFEKGRDVVEHPFAYTPLVKKELTRIFENKNNNKNYLLQYLLMVLKLTISHPQVESLRLLIELIGCVPELSKAIDVNAINEFVYVPREGIQRCSAILIAIIIGDDDENFDKKIRSVISKHNNKSVEYRFSAVLIMAYSLERRYFRLKAQGLEFNNSRLFSDIHSILMKHLANPNLLLLRGASEGIGVIGRSISLSLNRNNARSNVSNKLKIVNSLLEIVQNRRCAPNLKEKAARSLGLICVGEKFPYTSNILEDLLETANDQNVIEIQFEIGMTLTNCIMGTYSCDSRDAWTCTPEEFRANNPIGVDNDVNLQWLVDSLLTRAGKANSNTKQALCIWMLFVVKSFTFHEIVKNRILDIQKLFFDFLSEKNQTIVDFASKGLCIIYEGSDQNIRNDLLKHLSTLFESNPEAVLNEIVTSKNSINGSDTYNYNLIIYKELLSLVTAANKPDLIYKIMSIANHDNVWSSYKWSLFGFKHVLKKINDNLNRNLTKLLPKLFRYQFDPDVRVQTSMKKVWNAVAPDYLKVMSARHGFILADLVTTITSNQWRIRYASCSAILEFLNSCAGNCLVYDFMPHFPKLWTQLMIIFEDTNEDIKLIAMNTACSFNGLCVLASTSTRMEWAKEMLKTMLPVFIEKGLTSKMIAVRTLVMEAILQMTKLSGDLLKPYMETLIPAVLESLPLEQHHVLCLESDHEVHFEHLLDTEVVNKNYNTEISVNCVQYIDITNVETVLEKVIAVLKNLTRLDSKIMCIKFIISLFVHLKQDLVPFSKELYAVISNGLQDQNLVLANQYGVAIGYLVAILKPTTTEKLVSKLQLSYFHREDDVMRSTIATAVQSIADENHDVFNEFSDKLLPLIFFAKHEEETSENSSTVDLWNDIWLNFCPTTELALRKLMTEISNLISLGFQSSFWNTKAQAANCIKTIAKEYPQTLDSSSANLFLNMLVDNLQGKIWTGKSNVLNALEYLTENCKEYFKENRKEDIDKVIDTVIKELNKDDISYKINVLTTLGSVLEAFEVNRFEEVFNIVETYLTQENTTLSKNERDLDIKLRKAVYLCLGKSWPVCLTTQDLFQNLYLTRCEEYLSVNCTSVQIAILRCLDDFIKKLVILTDSQNCDKEIIADLFKIINKCLTNNGLISKALDLLLTLCEKSMVGNNENLLIYINSKVENSLMILDPNQNDIEIKLKVEKLLSIIHTFVK